jgi:hypothetical protein
MKIYEIEAGERNPVSNDANEKIIELLTTECSDAISAMQQAGTFLYRGFKDAANVPEAFHARPREDRRALHSNPKIQIAFDENMKVYGFATNRSNSIFCTSVKKRTSIYGYPYLIFPKNGFNFLWSPDVYDLFSDPQVDGWAETIMQTSNKEAAAQEFVRRFKYTDSNFVAALEKGHEIMVSGEYYAFSANNTSEVFKQHYGDKINFETILSATFKIPSQGD